MNQITIELLENLLPPLNEVQERINILILIAKSFKTVTERQLPANVTEFHLQEIKDTIAFIKQLSLNL